MPNLPPGHINGLAAYLLQDGLLSAAAISSQLAEAQKQKIPLITHLVRMGILASREILNCCAKHLAIPVFDLDAYEMQHEQINPELMLRYRILPLYCEKNTLYVGMSDPTDLTALSALRFHTGLSLSPMLVCEAALDKILSSLSRSTRLGTQLESALAKIIPIEESISPPVLTEMDDGPMSEFVTRLIDDAVLQQVSDIHIEPFPDHCRIRFRRDGLLSAVATMPPHFAARLIMRLKILSHLNIAERRLPQDGRLHLPSSSKLDIRINTCPTLSGEKMVLRLLNASKINLNIHELGMTTAQQQLFLSRLQQPEGLILVTGPTGSGKTITLYSALHYLNQIEKNICSAEDPVEIEFAGINQVNINPRIGLDFAMALRALLRQDPDILMIGEIRDTQTANIAIQAAQTGHLVLSTLHTNNAIETIARLQSIGIAAQHFISSVSLIIAQRLVRKLCMHCKIQSSQHFTLPKGCEYCYQGYKGRIGIFECIPITEKMTSLILSGANAMQLHNMLQAEKWMSLWEAGMALMHDGLTSYAELLRVIGKDRE